ncbi:hypothetical protein DQ04_00851070 [Trypanosoma grayi]|uniref:hypothetical protein n=1 Tax=Trypanosoma grayi TaxID=71804 RepID=UPI0004F3FAB0|nr:hypothetical protein DQ04_00851070 [Trypanosoma grayi]KEG13681.1 hypothetical protein DQ04_00851070 [Trypanosoma grayi]
MTAVVMCDGAAAASKAIGWAAIPGHLMRQHDGEQLILLHVWGKESLQRPAAVKDLEKVPQLPDDPAALYRISPSLVVQKTLEAITESKVTRDSLNYKLETMALCEPAVTPPPPSAPAPQPSASSKLAVGVKKESEPQSVVLTDAEIEAAAREAAEKAAQCHANAIALYAHERALHHQAKAILLGSGNRVEGKNVVVGHVGRAALNTLRQTHALWFIKSNGCTLRSGTTQLRYVVVLVPRPGDAESLARDCCVVQYALGRCREKSSDTVSAVVVAEGGTLPEDVERHTQALQALLRRDTPAPVPEGQNDEGVADSATATVSLPSPPLQQEEEEQQPESAEEAVDESSTPRVVVSAVGETPAPAEEADDVAEKEQWPEVSVCHLRATKQVVMPTARSLPIQIVKFLQRHKTDVVVLPSTVPEELQLALLATSKQHVLVVPSAEPMHCSSEATELPVETAECTE